MPGSEDVSRVDSSWEQQGVKDLKKKRAIAKGKMSRKIELFKDLFKQNSPIETLNLVRNEIEKCYENVERFNDSIMEEILANSEEGEFNSQIGTCTKYMEEIERERLAIHGMNNSNTLVIERRENFKLKAIDPPSFDGNIRDWPTFKSDFDRLVVPVYGEDPYVLKQCLKGYALEAVRGVEDNYKRMVDRLTERYGNESHILESVLRDIKQLKPMYEYSAKRFIDMVNVVERCWLDLQKMGLSSEMNNLTNLRMIENLLPAQWKREWALRYQNMKEGEDTFEKLIEFLINERKVIYYSEIDFKTSANPKSCSYNLYGDKGIDLYDVNNAIMEIKENQEKYQRSVNEFMNSTINMLKGKNIDQVKSFADGGREKFDPYNQSRCWYHKTNGHLIQECSNFLNLNKNDKLNMLKAKGACYSCLQIGHMSRDCKNAVRCDKWISDTEACRRRHHPCIHDVFQQENGNFNIVSNNLRSRKDILLMVSYVKSNGILIPTLWDAGSNLSLITFRMAKRLGLKGERIKLSVTKVGNVTEDIDTRLYTLPLVDLEGNVCEVEVCGMSDITSPIPKVEMDKFAKVFGLEEHDLERPYGQIELLIGSDYAGLIPLVVKTVDNLQLMKNKFGFCVRGSLIPGNNMNRGMLQVNVNHVSFAVGSEMDIIPMSKLDKQFDKFFSVEDMGIQGNIKCGTCKCGRCPVSGEFSMKEERELRLIEEGLKYDADRKKFVVSYPYLIDPIVLSNNYNVAFARLRATEKRLLNKGTNYVTQYEEQIQDMISRGVARKLLAEEVRNYRGPVFYLPHQEVNNPNSKSTPLRIVFNSSAKYNGYSLNEILPKGPDVLTSMFGVLLRFREGKYAVVGDIRKMYNSVEISEMDQHLHRFVWRSMNEWKNPDQYVLTTVTFGDKPSGIIAMLALRRAAKMIPEYGETGNKIIENTYVDDILVSLPTIDDVNKFLKEAESLLAMGDFHIKHWIISGDARLDLSCEMNIIESQEEKVLGLRWNPKTDLFMFKAKLNFSKKSHKLYTEFDVQLSDFEDKFPLTLTKRIALSQTSLIFDPLGFLTPFVLQAKLLLRELTTTYKLDDEKLSWDDPLPECMYQKWKAFFRHIYDIELLTFSRCIHPFESVSKPILVLFSDASNLAYGCCAYIRYELGNGIYSSMLLAAKSKLAPVRQITIPRLELCAAVLSARLRESIMKEMKLEFQEIVHITDSEIVRAQINNDKLKFHSFVAVRVAEIQEKTDAQEWYWVSSHNNPADLTTRIAYPNDLHKESIWQKGPPFMELPRNDWPIHRNCNLEITDTINMRREVCTFRENQDLDFVIDINRYSSYKKLLRSTARVLNVVRTKSLKEMFRHPDAKELENAEIYWVKLAQTTLSNNWEHDFRRLGPFKDANEVIKVGSRLNKITNGWNLNEFSLLPANHLFTKLYVKYIHEISHSGVESTLAKIQAKYWIPGVRRLIKSVRSRCVTCRKIDERPVGQNMGQLIPERISPSPPFYNTACDFFGPFMIKDFVKGRAKRKAYGIVFNCLATRAVYIDVVGGYDTENLLVTLRRFVSIHGFPRTMFSDGGPQLVAANKELRDMLAKLDKTRILEFGSIEGMIWKFNKSADAPWENGCSESIIRLVKRALYLAVGTNTLNFGELQTAFFEVANLLNERPIGIKPGIDIDKGVYLCPNELLLGRTSRRVPVGVWDEGENYNKRMEHIQNVVQNFWKRWMRDYFPTLLVRQKWHHSRRNLKVGDIVVIQERNIPKSSWRMAEVIEAVPGRDGKVRDVCVRYKPQTNGRNYYGKPDSKVMRSVHKLVVILPVEEI